MEIKLALQSAHIVAEMIRMAIENPRIDSFELYFPLECSIHISRQDRRIADGEFRKSRTMRCNQLYVTAEWHLLISHGLTNATHAHSDVLWHRTTLATLIAKKKNTIQCIFRGVSKSQQKLFHRKVYRHTASEKTVTKLTSYQSNN